MAGKRETTTGQLRIVGGTRQETPANLAVVERGSFLGMGRSVKGQLFVLVELSGGAFGREELCHELVMAIGEEYFHTPGTVTYGLRQAVLLANTHLLRENARVSSEHRLGGVACVALCGEQMFVAQVGWPMIYLVHQAQVHAFPDTLLEGEDISMLGQHQTTQVRLFHSLVQSEDMILMVDGPMARQLGITRIGQIVAGSVEQALRNLEVLAPPEDCTAMVVQVGGTRARLSSQVERWAFMEVERPEERAEASAGVAPMARREQPERRPAFVPAEEEEEEEPTSEAPQPPAFAGGPLTRPAADRPGPALGHGVTDWIKNVGQRAQSLFQNLLPDKQEGAAQRTQRRRSAARARRRRGEESAQVNWWVVAALVVPLLVLLLVGGYTLYRNWSQQSQFKAKLEAARLKRDMALSNSQSPVVARDDWLETISLANEAAALQPDNVEAQQLRDQAEKEVDRIDGVTRLGVSFKLYDYTTPGSAPGKLIVAGLDVYVLDRGGGRVYHHALNDLRNALRNPTADQVLVQQGQPVEGKNVGGLVDIAWMKDGGDRQAGALLVLDTNGVLLEYDPTWEQFQAQTLGGVSQWRSPYALATYDSNLYLLDPVANQVFKYTNQQFTGEPTRWFSQASVNIAKAIDIGIDGSIYLLQEDGQIAKYYGGEAASFAVTRMPVPLSKADALYMDIQEVAQYIYVADSSEARVVQLDREGAFVRQFKPARGQEETFRRLASLFVDETGGKLYYVSGTALYVTELPPLQR